MKAQGAALGRRSIIALEALTGRHPIRIATSGLQYLTLAGLRVGWMPGTQGCALGLRMAAFQA